MHSPPPMMTMTTPWMAGLGWGKDLRANANVIVNRCYSLVTESSVCIRRLVGTDGQR